MKAGTTCIAVKRERLPRGRSARLAKASDDQVLRDRIDHLEEVVTRLQQTQPTDSQVNVHVSDRALQVTGPVA